MLFTKIYRLLGGYVSFSAQAGFPERFINLCSLNGIRLWNLKTVNGVLTACTNVSGYRCIRHCAVRSGMRLKVRERHGLPFFAEKYRYRAGVPIGLLLFFIIIYALSSCVWTIDISGNTVTPDSEILEVLEQAGLKPGVAKGGVNAPQIRFYALARLDNVSYIAVNLMGSCVNIDVTERTQQPVVTDEETPCEVVSAVDGQITVLEVYEGTKLYKVGEAVRAGDVLAAGFVELADGSVRFRHAQAYAVIRTRLDVGSLQEDMQPVVRTEEKRRLTLHFFGLDIPLFIDDYEQADSVKNYALTVGGKRLPIGYTVEFFNAFAPAQACDDNPSKGLAFTESYLLDKIRQVGGSKVIEETVNVNPSGVSAGFTVEMSAGIQRAMLIE